MSSTTLLSTASIKTSRISSFGVKVLPVLDRVPSTKNSKLFPFISSL